MDAEVLEEILKNSEPEKKAREIEIKISARLRKHAENPEFKALGERLEQIKERHEQGFLTSLDFLKAILAVAKDLVEAEKGVSPEEGAESCERGADRAIQRSQNPEYAHHRGTNCRRHRRHC